MSYGFEDDHDEMATIPDAIREWAYAVCNEDERECKCHGCGWMCSDYDTWTSCPWHYKGEEKTPHPDSVECDYEEIYEEIQGPSYMGGTCPRDCHCNVCSQ